MTVIERIDGAGCGCGAAPHGTGLISIDEAMVRIARHAVPIAETEDVPLDAARGRVLATQVRARAMVPAFDNAAMDGYALRSADLCGTGPWRLALQGRIAAGQPAAERLQKGHAIQIFTGAPVPDGADAVVMQEVVKTDGRSIIVAAPVPARTNLRFAGEDMAAGATAVRAGCRLTPRDIAACAAAGAAKLRVRRPMTVALVVTGDEVHGAGRSRSRAGIWDVNTPMLAAAMADAGLVVKHREIAGDSRDGLRDQLAALQGRVDLIVTTGGVSVGEEDHVKPAVLALGGAIDFSGVAIKPGKPVCFGRLGRTNWLGLPGNPLSAFVTWSLFSRPLISAVTGMDGGGPARRNVVTETALSHMPGRCEFRLARIAGMDALGREVVRFASATHSGRVGNLPEADGLIFLPAETETLPAGALVEFRPFPQD